MNRPKYFCAFVLLLYVGSAALSSAGDDAKKHLKQGDVCFGEKRYICAIAEYREVVRLAPDQPTAHQYLGDALYESYNAEEAVPEFREAIRLKPNDADLHNRLGNALDGAGDPQGAIAEFKESIRLNPRLAVPHDGMADTLFRSGDLDAAIAELREAVRIDRNFEAGLRDLCKTLRLRGSLHDAIQTCSRVNNTQGDLYLGMALRDIGDLNRAIKVLRRDLYYHVYYTSDELGVTLFDKGDIDGAIAQHREAILLDPDYATAHYHLGLALQKKGDLAGAVAEYERALALDETHPPEFEYFGYSPRAVTLMRQAGIFEPELAQAHISLGQTLESQGDSAGASAQYNIALDHAQRAVEHTQWKRWDYIEILAEAFFLNHKFSDALAAEQKVAELCPDLHDVKQRVEKYSKAVGGTPN